MFGFEVDMVSLGDADCLVVTAWGPFGPSRVLIDGGSSSNAPQVKYFLLAREYTSFAAAVCTHPHEDHAGGLIEVVKDPRFGFATAWMHDIRKHVSSDALRRASSGSSSQAQGVKEVVETTKELFSAFGGRNLYPMEPFAGTTVSIFPNLVVLGPSRRFYENVISDFTRTEEIPLWAALETLTGKPTGHESLFYGPSNRTVNLASLFAPALVPIPFAGVLRNSGVKVTATTQPSNNTSVILGSIFNGNRLMFTADAGSPALDRVPTDWHGLTWMQVPHHASNGNLSQRDIERFFPMYACISACGDCNHPSRAIVNGLIKVGAQVFSTHQSSNLHFYVGNVPSRWDYSPAVALKRTGSRQSSDWAALLGTNR